MEERETVRVSERLATSLAPERWVLAIFRNGSTVVGTDQPGSDLDFTVIVRQKQDRKRALRTLKRHFRYLGLHHRVPSFAGRTKLCITLLDRATLSRLLRTMYRSPKDFLDTQALVQHKIVEAVPVLDARGLLPKCQQRATAYPRRIQKAVYRGAIRALEDAYQDWGTRNEFHYAFELPSLLEAICLALYAQNRRLFMPPFKRLHKDLKELEPNVERELYRLARGGRSERSRREGRRVLRQVIVKLTAASGT